MEKITYEYALAALQEVLREYVAQAPQAHLYDVPVPVKSTDVLSSRLPEGELGLILVAFEAKVGVDINEGRDLSNGLVEDIVRAATEAPEPAGISFSA
ncbi:hypothetical protein ACWEPZ_31440 [Streptomyces sp. NPDC004288]